MFEVGEDDAEAEYWRSLDEEPQEWCQMCIETEDRVGEKEEDGQVVADLLGPWDSGAVYD